MQTHALLDVLQAHRNHAIMEQMIAGYNTIAEVPWHALMQTQDMALLRYAESVRDMTRPASWTKHYFEYATSQQPINVDMVEFILAHTFPYSQYCKTEMPVLFDSDRFYYPAILQNKRLAEVILQYRYVWSPEKQLCLMRIALRLHSDEAFAHKMLDEVPMVPLEEICTYIRSPELANRLYRQLDSKPAMAGHVIQHAIKNNDLALLQSLPKSAINYAVGDVKYERTDTPMKRWFAQELISQPFTVHRNNVIAYVLQQIDPSAVCVYSNVLMVADNATLRELGQTLNEAFMKNAEHAKMEIRNRPLEYYSPYPICARSNMRSLIERVDIKRFGMEYVLGIVISLNTNAHVSFQALGDILCADKKLRKYVRDQKQTIIDNARTNQAQLRMCDRLIALTNSGPDSHSSCIVS